MREILYGVPPLFHVNRSEWVKNGKIVSRYYSAVGNFLQVIAPQELLEFNILTKDRLVQKTIFTNGL
ncbi:MAG: hypothetical protein KC505_01170 [Myxococcales bacterium]|nr:hypothetical protein [Myxococcales bacterium]USN50847.1 MAG: hypothetical protein H6731_00035 [Myxococcales bacterium]